VRTHLILGGARSGKSRRALSLAKAHAGEVWFVATAREDPSDPEWCARIERHRRERPAHWRTVESPEALPELVRAVARSDRLLLIDCLGLWLAQRIEQGADLDADAEALCAALQESPGSAIVVSNEVGMGVVPPYPSGRRFRDALGILNQRVAAVAEVVELVVAGCVWPLKGGLDERDRVDR